MSEAVSALEQVRAGLAALVAACDDGELAAMTGDELLALAHGFETVRNTLPVVDHAVVGACEASSQAARRACRNTQTLLSVALRLSPAEAGDG